jgi:hypothetical protein
MKKLIHLIFTTILFMPLLKAQTLSISEEIYIGNAEGYGIIGKMNDRILFFSLDDNKVKVKSFDTKLHKVWDRDIEPDRKNQSKVLEVLGSRQDFNVIYQYRKKGHNYIKAHKYDAQVKLLDSITLKDWGKDLISPTLKTVYSEDRKVILVYEIVGNDHINALAVSFDSLRPIWYKSFDFKNWDYDRDNYSQIIISNQAEAFFIKEEENRGGSLERHRVLVKRFTENEDKEFDISLKDVYGIDMKFGFDNANQRLMGAGVYSAKNFTRAQGYYTLTVTPQYKDYKITYQLFDDAFVSAVVGKKVTDNKGLNDLTVREIVHKRDGGMLAIYEQVREIERQTNPAMSGRMWFRGDKIRGATDYYYDNILAVSVTNTGVTDWKSIFYKKQMSQDDDARFCSYFLVKTPSALRFQFNDEVERATTVSEYVLNGIGENERHTIFNTEGQNVSLRFRDAMQVAANEVIVPSDDRRRVRLVKILY